MWVSTPFISLVVYKMLIYEFYINEKHGAVVYMDGHSILYTTIIHYVVYK